MSKLDPATIRKYQEMLGKNPNSQVFAPLAEHFRAAKMLIEAEKVAKQGVHRHPNFPGGLVTYSRILRDLGRLDEALDLLIKVNETTPENILAHLTAADIHLQLKNPKEALKSFKMVLLFNPKHEKAQMAVKKLESLTADEYEEEVFALAKLSVNQQKVAERLSDTNANTNTNTKLIAQTTDPLDKENSQQKDLERMLSLIDAFIVRNDLEKAVHLLRETEIEFGKSPGISRRLLLLEAKSGPEDDAAPISPILSRENQMRDRKVAVLKKVLGRISQAREI